MSKKSRNSLIVIAVFVALFLGAGYLSNMVQPWLHASEPYCAKYDKAAHAYRNDCDHPINFGWTARRITAPIKQNFEFVRLDPGETTIAWRETARNMPRGHRFHSWACRAPHIPADVSDADHAGRTKSACRNGAKDS